MGANMDKTMANTNRELISYLFPYYKKHAGVFFMDLLCAALTTICELALPILIAGIMDTASSQGLSISYILRVAGIYIALRIVEVISRYYMQSIGHMMGAKIERDMRQDVFLHLQTLSYSFFTKAKTGHLMASLTTDLFDVTEFSHHCPEEFFIGFVKLMVSLIVLIRVDIPLTLIIFAMIPFIFYFTNSYRRRMRKSQLKERHQIGSINARIEDSFQGIHEVKSYANEEMEAKKFSLDNHAFLDIKRTFYKALASFTSITRLFDGVMFSLVILFGGLSLVWGRISSGNFVAYLLYVQTLMATLDRIVQFMEQFEKGMSGLERFGRIMAEESDIVEKEGAKDLENPQGNISFQNVSFRYPGAEKDVLKDFSLDILAGKKVAFAGPSGVGKTTLIRLLPRFYDVSSGSIQIDGVDIRDLTLTSLRKNIGFVSQDVYLFNGTIKENIAYGKPDSSFEEIKEAAKLADAYDFIMKLDGDFDAQVGQRGVLLSGGQKQRISIARAFLKNPPILILDEATSALDNRSEHWIQQSLDALASGRTTFVIAHRLSTIKDADEIILLSKEGILEKGSHKELMDKEGEYYKLYQLGQNQ